MTPLVIPCVGSLDGLDACLDGFLDQEYPGELETIFVVPSRKDPAYEGLELLRLRRPDRTFRVIVTDLVPERTLRDLELLGHKSAGFTLPHANLSRKLRKARRPRARVRRCRPLPAAALALRAAAAPHPAGADHLQAVRAAPVRESDDS